ncbi:superoxide dismutase [Xylella fastidiosa subsp. multiplex]|uniref:superoxide dismutase n=1 Tax=Xylella fastidiosa TaxID=2371 RepID=UPI0018928DD4|nr:superoxide dismutase [Xylella fastidiosa]QPC02616.1 superoxide dismutase [Xylella fastidiosa subsp. multiplex]
MKLLCLDVPQPGASLEKYQPYMLDEVRHGWQMYKSDIIRDIYFRQDRPGVVFIVEAESVDAARKTLSKFPLAEAGLIGWDVIPLGPFVNWEALFASGNA